MGDCIFCAIAARRSPGHIIWENETVVAFLDIFPLSRGHVLVVPKEHVDRLTDLPPQHHAAVLGGVAEICRRIERLSDNYNVGINQGAIAGQVVFHLHFHVIPRYPHEPGFPRTRNPLEAEDARKLVEVLSAP